MLQSIDQASQTGGASRTPREVLLSYALAHHAAAERHIAALHSLDAKLPTFGVCQAAKRKHQGRDNATSRAIMAEIAYYARFSLWLSRRQNREYSAACAANGTPFPIIVKSA